ncbi:hypothetical protein [Marivirga arenosa]|uniref:Uncharacterized protein n=1 Tax=Marivirga arenosa TaxID=3059076 RepID=A0AA51ZVQ5_9BACT|nr:hypothetical protein [Marivirga sp. BKB1-2]WNB17612.1 hypothetical protein QYS47_34470 [Marivirga sp. BKB1-2]
MKQFEIYIAAQRATGMQITIFGIALLLVAVLLHFSQLNPITQGLRNSFLVISILLLVSGIGFIVNQKSLLKSKTETYQADPSEFKKQEVERMEGVNKSVPKIILGLSIILIIILLALILLIKQPLWRGVSYGISIYFLGLLIVESISYLSVKTYLNALLN